MKKRRLIKPTWADAGLVSAVAAMGGLYAATLGSDMQEAYLALATLGLIALSLGLERIWPQHRAWNQSHGDTVGDVASFVLIAGIMETVLKWGAPLLFLALFPAVAWASDWPLLAQIIAAALLIELGAWVSHFLHHRWPRLWQLHAMHHSTERLYTLNNFRFHPFNYALNHVAAFIPPLLIGLSPEAVLGYVALSMPVLMFQHSNLRVSFGLANRVLNTNDLHRWHHSTKLDEGTRNLGRALVIWDHLFGTYFNPADRQEPDALGLSVGERFPQARYWLRQLAWPFSPECCAR